jgi:hypothetical protein
MNHALLYVSKSTLALPQDAWKVDEIVSYSRAYNARVGITGALMFTETHFVQFLEGPEAEVSSLLQSIKRDHRHRDLAIMMAESQELRRFPTWSMAYSGPHLFVEAQLAPLLDEGRGARAEQAVDDLIHLMLGFAGDHAEDPATG